MDTFLVLKVLAQWAMPPASMAVGLVIAGMVALLRWRRLAWLQPWLPCSETLAFAWPPVSGCAHPAARKREARANASVPACCYDAIVVLGGGINPAPPHLRNPTSAMAPIACGMPRNCFIVASHRGSSSAAAASWPATTADRRRPEAEAMRRFLNDLGVPDRAIVSEDRSLNTIQNIERVREMVKGKRVAPGNLSFTCGGR